MTYIVYEPCKYHQARFYDVESIERAAESWGLENLTSDEKTTVCVGMPSTRGFLMFDLQWDDDGLQVRRR